MWNMRDKLDASAPFLRFEDVTTHEEEFPEIEVIYTRE
jgi:hypothetical protein